MDNNFSKILDIFKRLDEGVMSEVDAELRDIVARQDFDALYDLFSANTPAGHYVQDLYQDISIDHRLHGDDDFEQIEQLVFDRLEDQFGGVKEGSKFNFAGEKRGQKPGDQWRGKDAGIPGNKLVGASESIDETELPYATTPPPYAEIFLGSNNDVQECGTTMSPLEQKLRARWNKHKQGLAEFGAGNPGQATSTGASNTANPIDQQKTAKELQQTQTNLNKLKAAGVAIPTSVSQASQAAMKASNNPTANPTQTDKKVSMGLGQEIEKLLTTGNQNQIGQVANVLKQVKQGQG